MREQLCQIKMPLEFAALQWTEITPPPPPPTPLWNINNSQEFSQCVLNRAVSPTERRMSGIKCVKTELQHRTHSLIHGRRGEPRLSFFNCSQSEQIKSNVNHMAGEGEGSSNTHDSM